MPTLDALRHTLAVIEALRSIVHTMRALAAASIRQYDQAVTALTDYDSAVRRGLAVVLGEPHHPAVTAIFAPATREPPLTGALVFGSDHGLCGRFNEALAAYVRETLPPGSRVAAVGARLAAALEEQGWPPEQQFPMPDTASAIHHTVQRLLPVLEQWRMLGVTEVRLFHNRHRGGSGHEPTGLALLPLDLAALQYQPLTPSHSLPGYAADRVDLLALLLQEWFFVQLFRACAESLASECASRLLAMQAAERNITDRLAELNAVYRQQRQEAITTELLDVMAGFEALTGSRQRN